EVARETELVPAHKLPAGAVAVDDDPRRGLLLHADAGRSLVVLKDLLEFGGLFAAALVDAVKALGVLAGKVVDFQSFVVGNLFLVVHRAGLDRVGNGLVGFEMLRRQLERVVPEGVLAGADLLSLLPIDDAIFVAGAAQ